MDFHTQIHYAGRPLEQAQRVLILTHGRGATADSILSLAEHLHVTDFALVAPQATGHTWYPYSFLAPTAQNEPGLSSGLALLGRIVDDLKARGFQSEQIFLVGFSQGACLTAEFAGRNAQRFGGVFVLTGGLIGEQVEPSKYSGDFAGTPIFISTGDPDAHVPVARVAATAEIFRNLGAQVTERIYPRRPHTVSADEVETINRILMG